MKTFSPSRRAVLGAALAGALPAGAASSKLSVVASFSILADLTRQVGADAVEIVSLVGPDGDAHVFEPTPQDARKLQQARVLITNGLGFEGWIPRLKESAGFKGLEIVASKGVKPRSFSHPAHGVRHGGGHDHHRHEERDPHAWQDVRHVVVYVQNIANGLAEVDPINAPHYRARAAGYVARLNALDARIRQTFAALPADRRSVVTTHDAFGYYAAAYGLRFVPARGVSTESEPSAREMAGLIELIRKERIAALFAENITDPRLLEQLARETGAVIGGKLYSDALSAASGPAATYIGLMESNTAALFKALSQQPGSSR